ncbi:unnamed protein product [Symbiodinium microadriaticum]|nr:unnamed protein product [Symbiodinium microadriaticum]
MGGVLCCDEAGSTSQRSQRGHSPQKGRSNPYANPLPTTPSDPWSSAMAAKSMPQIPKVSRSCFVCYTCAATDKAALQCLAVTERMSGWVWTWRWAAALASAQLGGAAPRCGSARLADGNCLWFHFHSYFSPGLYADERSSQKQLLNAFLIHYLKMSIPASNFLGLIQVNRYYGKRAGKTFAESLRRDFGIRHVRLVLTGKNTSNRDLEFLSWLMLHEHTQAEDWIIKADVDEFHVFSPHRGIFHNGTFDAHAYFNALNQAGKNIVNGFLIDRVAHKARLPDVRPTYATENIMNQFPVVCGVTALFRLTDPRKVVAYKAYIRAPSSHHFAFGVDQTFYPCDITESCHGGRRLPVYGRRQDLQPCLVSATNWHHVLRRKLGRDAFALMPFKYHGHLPLLNPLRSWASAFHLKWHSGLWSLQKEARFFGGRRLPEHFEDEFRTFVGTMCYPAMVKKAYEAMSEEEMGRMLHFPAPANPDGWWHLLANLQVNTYCNGLHGMKKLLLDDAVISQSRSGELEAADNHGRIRQAFKLRESALSVLSGVPQTQKTRQEAPDRSRPAGLLPSKTKMVFKTFCLQSFCAQVAAGSATLRRFRRCTLPREKPSRDGVDARNANCLEHAQTFAEHLACAEGNRPGGTAWSGAFPVQ